MYLTLTSATPQHDKSGCSALLKWTNGNQQPSFIQFYVHYGGVSNGLADLKLNLDFKATKGEYPTSQVIPLPCSEYFTIDVCPRLGTPGAPADEMADENGVATYWESFTQSCNVVTNLESSSSDGSTPPTITGIQAIAATLNNGNRFVVSFNLTGAETYLIRRVNTNASAEADQVETNRSPALIETLPSQVYSVGVEGHKNLHIKQYYSGWGPNIVARSADVSLSVRYFFQEIDRRQGIKQWLKGQTVKEIMGIY